MASVHFRPCPHCQLPHEVGLKACPMTGGALFDTETTRRAVVDDVGLVGSLLDDKYEVLEELGRGSMGRVYRGRHAKIGRDVALKVLLGDLAKSARVRDRFVREAQATGRVDHPNVVQIWDVGVTADGLPYMVMELLRGEPLSQRLDRERRLPLADALIVARQVLAGLAAAHAADVVHRDVKPENIVLVRRDRVKLVDFGVARVLGAETPAITQRGDLIGTPGYFAPEQGSGREIDHRTDAWAATVVLYEMVVGELPFLGGSVVEQLAAIVNAEPLWPSEVRPYLPASLDRVIQAGLEKDPDRRADVQALLTMVKDLELELEGVNLRDTADELPAAAGPAPERGERSKELSDTIEDDGQSVLDTIDEAEGSA
ncbi:MAG: serine/threonine protein kinase [Sandaracinaceae bacterium]|nr:serine/threonine protein kinase [Sandaracinaceae bacterium]